MDGESLDVEYNSLHVILPDYRIDLSLICLYT